MHSRSCAHARARPQYSLGSPMEAVCSRGDVPYAGSAWGHVDPIPKGCYDGKVTNLRLALRLQSEVVNGPTTSHGLPPFRCGFCV